MITSRGNAWFKRVRQAIREHEDEIVIEGPKAIDDAIAAGWKPIAVLEAESTSGFGRSSVDRPKPVLHLFSSELFREIADTKTSQGVIALFARPRWTPDQILTRRDSIAVALDGVQDPGNVGTIVRLAAAFDATGVILLPGCADPFGPKAIRASAGAILHVPVAAMTVEELLASKVDLYAADAAAAEQQPASRAAVIVFGGEGGGVSPAIRDRAKPIGIATTSRVESLNVAAAAAILMWRSFRER